MSREFKLGGGLHVGMSLEGIEATLGEELKEVWGEKLTYGARVLQRVSYGNAQLGYLYLPEHGALICLHRDRITNINLLCQGDDHREREDR